MRILGIETSCDETAIAVIEISGSRARPRIKVLSNIVSSQAKLHAKFGGVVPNLAKREHQRNLVPVLLTALSEANPSNKTKSGNRYDRSYFRMRGKLRDVGEILEREPELFARLAGALAKRARMVEYVLP
ncbi:MAG: hypothetical protein HYT40_02160, partial [Candidatus Sungbacteria bacterium]|nr:hypothetical protein [Candidatus Sungbacteria bacterium]